MTLPDWKIFALTAAPYAFCALAGYAARWAQERGRTEYSLDLSKFSNRKPLTKGAGK